MVTPTNDPVNWSRRPEPDDMPVKWDLMTIPPKGLSGLIILSHDVVGSYIHYQRGRTRPCEGDSCELCNSNAKPRWEGYIAVGNKTMSKQVILRLTPAAMIGIQQYFELHRTLRGASLAILRLGEKPNGKLKTILETARVDSTNLPKAPDLKKFLRTIWGVKKEPGDVGQSREVLTERPTVERDFGEASPMRRRNGSTS